MDGFCGTTYTMENEHKIFETEMSGIINNMEIFKLWHPPLCF